MKALTLFVLLFFAAGIQANACTCAAVAAPCAAYSQASVIFVGQVTKTSIVTSEEPGWFGKQRKVQFTVVQPFKNAERARFRKHASSGIGFDRSEVTRKTSQVRNEAPKAPSKGALAHLWPILEVQGSGQ